MKYFYVHLLICLPKIFAQRKKRTHLSGYSGQQCSSPKQGKNKLQNIFVLWTAFFSFLINKKFILKEETSCLAECLNEMAACEKGKKNDEKVYQKSA